MTRRAVLHSPHGEITEQALSEIWARWQHAMEYGYPTKAAEYRLMWLALYDRYHEEASQ